MSNTIIPTRRACASFVCAISLASGMVAAMGFCPCNPAIPTAIQGRSSVAIAVDYLKSLEGFRATSYQCAAGKPSIGYGFTAKGVVSKARITESEANKILADICANIAVKLRSDMSESGISLTPAQEAALISFCYNVGWANYAKSTLRKKILAGASDATIAAQFRQWIYITRNGRKVVCKGLANRREKELALYWAM